MNELILLYRSQTSFHIFRTKTNGIIFRITANAPYNKLHALSFTDTLFRWKKQTNKLVHLSTPTNGSPKCFRKHFYVSAVFFGRGHEFSECTVWKRKQDGKGKKQKRAHFLREQPCIVVYSNSLKSLIHKSFPFAKSPQMYKTQLQATLKMLSLISFYSTYRIRTHIGEDLIAFQNNDTESYFKTFRTIRVTFRANPLTTVAFCCRRCCCYCCTKSNFTNRRSILCSFLSIQIEIEI